MPTCLPSRRSVSLTICSSCHAQHYPGSGLAQFHARVRTRRWPPIVRTIHPNLISDTRQNARANQALWQVPLAATGNASENDLRLSSEILQASLTLVDINYGFLVCPVILFPVNAGLCYGILCTYSGHVANVGHSYHLLLGCLYFSVFDVLCCYVHGGYRHPRIPFQIRFDRSVNGSLGIKEQTRAKVHASAEFSGIK